MAPVSRLQATKAKVVNRREFDSRSQESPEAALSFWHVLIFRARHACILHHAITSHAVEPVATSQPVV